MNTIKIGCRFYATLQIFIYFQPVQILFYSLILMCMVDVDVFFSKIQVISSKPSEQPRNSLDKSQKQQEIFFNKFIEWSQKKIY